MRLSVTEAATLYHVARTTIYRKVKHGELSSGSDKKIDLSELIRVFGEPVARTQEQDTKNSVSLHQEKETLLNERIKTLEDALASAMADKTWLKQQFEQAQKPVEQAQERVKLLEHKPSPPPKNGLFNKLVKAITG